jgi:hypothetical protein
MSHEVRDLFGPPPRRRRPLAAAAFIALVVNCGLLSSAAPRRLAFLHARPAFEASIAVAPPAIAGGKKCDLRLGVFTVDRLASDPRGGIYFRTRSGPDGFDTSTTTYGFSYRPNDSGSPFGDDQYTLSHLTGDWYSFQASSR